MKHEHFKSFGILNVSNPTDTQLEEFLSQGHITPRSISIVKTFEDSEVINFAAVIGYVPSKSEQKYKLVYENLGKYSDLASEVEDRAATHNGVICQHVGQDENGIMSVVFLVHE